MIYRQHHSENMERPIATPGPVLFWDDKVHGQAVIFSCPCGEREVYVTTQEGHGIEFDGDGRLTLHGSVGGSGRWKGENLCHFLMKAGEVEMLDDARCPGGSR